jgi:hypothetical protein
MEGICFLPPTSTSDGIPYYYYKNRNYLPSLEDIEQELSEYINKDLPFCTNGFIDFKDLDVAEGNVETQTRVEDERVIFDVEYPVTITRGEEVSRFRNFDYIKVISRIGVMYNSIASFIEDQMDQGSICLNCMSSIAETEGFEIHMVNAEEGIVFTFRDEYSLVKGVPIEWRFANKY